jgi:hypothetical protein
VDGTWSSGVCGTWPSGAGGSPRAAMPGHARERQRKGERELAGGPPHGVGPVCQ